MPRIPLLVLTRLVFLWLVAYPAAAAVPDAAPAGATPFAPEPLPSLHRALAPLHPQYDPQERMLKRPFSSPGYHTTLKGGLVHPTRDSLNYALACLDTGDPILRDWACAIVDRIVSLQDQDPASRTYGLWSWFLEEPLSKMSPPDWNWADFCGVTLLQIARDHGKRLPAELRSRVDTAIRHAARSIQRRNVGPDYTNIAIMGTYVTLVAAERYQLPDLLEYARSRLQRLHDHVTTQGAFTEYNSPTYTLVALKELARMRRDFTRPDDRALVEPLYRLAWEELALHFHAPTRQWAGPHSRCYRTLLSDDVLSFIERATDHRLAFGTVESSLDAHRVPAPCPTDLEPRFVQPRTETVVRTFVPGDLPVIGTTHLTPTFALGSVTLGDLWNQRRPLLAYFGDAAQPSYLRIRFLRDDYDLAAAQCFSVQQAGAVLAAIAFATDGGVTHVSLDRMKDATFDAEDLRLRFEFGGAAAKINLLPPAALDNVIELMAGPTRLRISVPYARFAGEPGRWEATKGPDTAHLDLVLHHGPRRPFHLNQLDTCALGLTLGIGDEPAAFPLPQASTEAGRLQLTWGDLKLNAPLRPAKSAELRRAVEFPAPTAQPTTSTPLTP